MHRDTRLRRPDNSEPVETKDFSQDATMARAENRVHLTMKPRPPTLYITSFTDRDITIISASASFPVTYPPPLPLLASGRNFFKWVASLFPVISWRVQTCSVACFAENLRAQEAAGCRQVEEPLLCTVIGYRCGKALLLAGSCKTIGYPGCDFWTNHSRQMHRSTFVSAAES